jgi:hypothetical protein
MIADSPRSLEKVAIPRTARYRVKAVGVDDTLPTVLSARFGTKC